MMTSLREHALKVSLALGLILFFMIAGLGPLLTLLVRSFEDNSRHFVGLANYIGYFTNETLFRTFQNTLFVSILTTGITVSAAFFYAYGIQRTTIPVKWLFRMIAVSPLFAPTLMHGIALVYLFGKKGIVTTGFFGLIPGYTVDIYGPIGIITAETICNFPSAFLLLSVALSMADRRLRDSADSMGASRWLRFICITLPSVKYGLLSAALTVFSASFVDFGAPKVIGGNYSVLSVEIYKQVVGLQNFNLGAAISLILALPAVVAFALDMYLQRKVSITFSSKSLPIIPGNSFKRNAVFVFGNSMIAGFILIINFIVIMASFVKSWPYRMELVLDHYDFSNVAGGGLGSFITSLQMSVWTAIFGSALAFFTAWVVQRSRLQNRFTIPLRFFSLLPLSLPGMVIGIAYIFFFNSPTLGMGPLTISNPLGFVYNSFWILVISNIFHFISVPFLTCSNAIAKMDPEMDSASISMGIPFWTTLRCVTLPLSIEAIAEVFLYFFVNSMITVSAVIFLFSPGIQIAAISVVDMEDAGDIAAAAAMSVLLLFTNISVRILYSILIKLIHKWRRNVH